jgi:hypothetical protein
MPPFSTDDCKAFLIDFYAKKGHGTTASHWMRLRKYKGVGGLVSREFEHPVAGKVVLVETSAGLSLESSKVADASPTAWRKRVFQDDDVAGARALVKKLLASGWDGDREDIKQTSDFEQFAHALPAVFSFHFPADTYGNDAGVDVKLSTKLGELCIMVEDMCGGSADEYSHSLVTEQLPSCVERSSMDEYHYGFEDEHKTMTVDEFIQTMLAAGFSYSGPSCMFGPLAKPIQMEPAPAASDQLALFSMKHVRAAIGDDDDVQFETFLKEGLHPDTLFANKRSLLSVCFEGRAKRCYGVLLQHNASLMLSASYGRFLLAVFASQPASWGDYVLPALMHPALDLMALGSARYGSATTLLEDVVTAVFGAVVSQPETAVRAGSLLGVVKSSCVGRQFSAAVMASLYAVSGVLGSATVRALIFAEVDADRSLLDDVPGVESAGYGFIAALVEQGDFTAALILMRHYEITPAMVYLDGVPLMSHLRNSMARLEAELKHEEAREFRMIAINAQGEEINEQRDELHRIRTFLDSVDAHPGSDAPSM